MWRSRSLHVVMLAAAACGDASDVADASVSQYDASMWTTLFDGTSTAGWRMSTITNQPGSDDPGRFEVVDGTLRAIPGSDIGLYWHSTPAPADFELALEWRQVSDDDNSGVFVRFPDPQSKGYNNTAYVAVDYGFEIQIDNRGFPDGADKHTTGAIYNIDQQAFTRVAPRAVGEWNDYRIRAVGQTYTVELNGVQTTRFENGNVARGVAAPAFVGLQTHPAPGSISYRNIRIRSL
jgi:hypothetical protein